MFWAQLGIGLATNLLGSMFSRQPQVMNTPYFQQMQKSMAQNQRDTMTMFQTMREQRALPKFDFEANTPSFPDQAAQTFESLQSEHQSRQLSLMNSFTADLAAKKEEAFETQHYQTTPDASGKARVALNSEGKPILQEGKETAFQKDARRSFETDSKDQLMQRHVSEKNTFLDSQKQQIMSYIDANKFQLANPYVQGELQRMILETRRRALRLNQTHEEEFWKNDLPSPGLMSLADDNIEQLRQMREEHADVEENSKEAKELAKFKDEVDKVIRDKKEQAKQVAAQETFLMKPGDMLKQKESKDPFADLPFYMVSALEEIGIRREDIAA